MMRCRLRFLLHEVDLPLGVTILGRGAECNVTLNDPLVSRRHARILVGTDRAVIEDAGSRNGVLVNDAPVRGLTPLRDGDRVRLGTQEFVFCDEVSAVTTPPEKGAASHLCSHCRSLHPRHLLSCPAHEETDRVGEDTLVGCGSPERPSLRLLVDVLDRALSHGQVADAQRLVRRTSSLIEQLVAAGGSVDAQLLAALAGEAADLTTQSQDPTWALWALDVYRDTHQIPPVDLVERLAAVGKAAALGQLARSDARLETARSSGDT